MQDPHISHLKRSSTSSMKRRASWHNYRLPGLYMLTLVIDGRKPLFGRLLDSDTPTVCLSHFGNAIAENELPKIHQYYPNVELLKTCIMPDHIHMIIKVHRAFDENKHLGFVVNGFKYGCNRAMKEMLEVSSPHLFEKGYHDRIIVDENAIGRWEKYLDDNPRRLALKRANPDLFTVLSSIAIYGNDCQMIGNRFLLDIPDKQAVIVHRSYSREQYFKLFEQWMQCGERGGVLVSAAIGPPEKAVLREAFNRGYCIILLRENGFAPLYKPAGGSFDACAEGRLLQISPWPYHSEKRTITRQQCLYLNDLAEKIAGGSHE